MPVFILDMGPNISKLLEPLFSLEYNRSRGPIIFEKASFISDEGLKFLWNYDIPVCIIFQLDRGGPLILNFLTPVYNKGRQHDIVDSIQIVNIETTSYLQQFDAIFYHSAQFLHDLFTMGSNGKSSRVQWFCWQLYNAWD